MMPDTPRRKLFDTNILVHGVRRGAIWERIKAACDPLMTEPRPLVSVVTYGELPAFAEQNDWGEDKRDQMRFLLDYFKRLSIEDPDIWDAYTLIDTYSRPRGVRMGKNDLWIAATAHVTGATLVTTDKDFDHLAGKFCTLIRIPVEL